MSVMISLRDVRLSNTTGHCVSVTAKIPTDIPAPLREDAIMAGMVETDEPLPGEPDEVPGSTPLPAPVKEPEPAPIPVKTKEVPATVEAPAVIEDTGVDDAEALATAVRKILVRNDPTDFKNDGTPKVIKVVGEMPPECKRPTATQVFAAYEKLQDDPELAITD